MLLVVEGGPSWICLRRAPPGDVACERAGFNRDDDARPPAMPRAIQGFEPQELDRRNELGRTTEAADRRPTAGTEQTSVVR